MIGLSFQVKSPYFQYGEHQKKLLRDATGALPPCQEGAVSYTRTHLAHGGGGA